MTVIKAIYNAGGQKLAKTGLVNLHSYNICPTTQVAASTPLVLSVDDFKLYDYFVVDQTSADTDEIDLPDATPTGTRFTIYCADVVELRTQTDTIEINGVASKGYTTVALDLIHVTKTALGWNMWKILEADGAVTSIVPATS